MEHIKKHLKTTHHILSVLGLAGITFAAMNFNNPPLFQNTDNFVLFAQEEIDLEKGVQISSGDLGSNGKIDIEKDSIVNGNLFADKISIDKNTTINGNVSFNKLKLAASSTILGATSTPVSLPIVALPKKSDFEAGTQNLAISGAQTIFPGSFNAVEVKPSSTLVLNPGIYNLNKINLRDNSKLLFSGPTTINVKNTIETGEGVLVAQTANIPSTDLAINVLGEKVEEENIREKRAGEEKTKEDRRDKDNGESITDQNGAAGGNGGEENNQAKTGTNEVEFGDNSLLNFKLLAPNSAVKLGGNATFRGQIMAREINVGEGGILSRRDFFEKESDPTKVVVDTDNSRFVVNEIVVNFTTVATLSDAQAVADAVGGRITAFVHSMNAYKIEVAANTPNDLAIKIQIIKQLNSSLIEGVLRNYVLNMEL